MTTGLCDIIYIINDLGSLNILIFKQSQTMIEYGSYRQVKGYCVSVFF